MIHEGAANSGMSLDLDKECIYNGEGTVCIVKGQVYTMGNTASFEAGVDT
jgi:hypothetical protein